MDAAAERAAAGALGAWLSRGAPDDDAPALPAALRPQDLGPLYERHLLRGRRERGAYYSPPALVQPLLDEALPAGEEPEVVLDPACGGGAFLLGAAERLGGGPRALHRLRGLDSDPGAVAVARLALSRLLAAPLGALRGVCRGDALRDPGLAPGSVDVIVGNPPFLGEEDHGADLAALRGGSRVAAYLQPRTDLAYLFCHLCLDLLRPGGRLGLVLPEGLLHADGASLLRRRLLAEARVERLTLVELPPPALFPGAPGQRCCLLSLRKGSAPAHRPRVARLDAEGLRDLHRAPTQRALLAGGAALRLGAPEAEALCQRMDRAGPRLGAGYSVTTGVQAGPGRLSERQRRELGAARAGVFVLDEAEVEALDLSLADRALLRPFYLPGDLPPLGPLPAARRALLYLTPATCPDLQAHPALLRHFAPLRPLLERRRETRLGYRAYHHLHWPRDEAAFLGPKLLCVRQAPAPRACLAPAPAFVDLGANVLRPGPAAPLPLLALAALLHSAPVMHYLRARGKRKGPILQLDAAPLRALPLPRGDRPEVAALSALGAQIVAAPSDEARAALRVEADALAAAAYGLSSGWERAAAL